MKNKSIKSLLLLSCTLLLGCGGGSTTVNPSSSSSNVESQQSSLINSESSIEKPSSESVSSQSSEDSESEIVSSEQSSENESISSEQSSESESIFSSQSSEEISSSIESSSENNSSSVESSSQSSEIIEEDFSNRIVSQKAYSEGYTISWTEQSLNNVTVTYSYGDSNEEISVPSQLIRLSDNVARMDAIGLKPGTYKFNIHTSDNKTIKVSNVEIKSYDRSGYAHFKNNTIGAYNNDGTLKSNATVIYVNDENKNTVQAVIGGKTYTGLVSILANQSKSSTPLDVRIVGRINAATWNKIDYKVGGVTSIEPANVIGKNGVALTKQSYTESEIIAAGFNDLNDDINNGITKLNGLTNKVKYDSSKDEFDSYYNMCDISGAQNLTVEGIGEDAMLYQWGFTFKNCSYVEVRNLTFDDYTEDACSFEGTSGTYNTLDSFTSGHIWIHNNTFNEGKNNWDVCNEQDKHEGDGATDFKYNANITVSYNHYYKNHKTGLVGGSSTQRTASITFHHNYYDSCVSRLPLARKANMHMYNNYYYKSGTSLSIRAHGYAFVEGCYFEGGSNPMVCLTEDGAIGAIKSYNNILDSTSGQNMATVVTNREEAITNYNLFSQTFDTDSSIFYYDKTNKVSNVSYLTSAEQAKIDTQLYSGPCKSNPLDKVDQVTPPEIDNPEEETSQTYEFDASQIEENTYTESFTQGIFKVNATADRTVAVVATTSFKSIDTTCTREVKLGGQGTNDYRSISFNVSKATTIDVIARSANSSTARSLVIKSALDDKVVYTFDAITSAQKQTCDIEKGSYYLTSVSGGINIAKVKIN